MKHITRIELVNYKAFVSRGDANTLTIPPGKNVLIYGENGSGKSSIYEGLKQFFNSADDTYADSPSRNVRVPRTFIENAGTPEEQELLTEVAVAVDFSDGQGNDESKIFGVAVNTARETGYVRSANLLGGFLSYRELLRTYLLDNLKDDFEFGSKFALLLIETILKHKTNRATRATYQNAWESLNRPRGRNKEEELSTFNTGFQQDINDINLILNDLLGNFYPDLSVTLENQGSYVDYFYSTKNDRSGIYPVCQVNLNILHNGAPVNNGEETHLTVLNEARLSALAISIYLTALIITTQENLEYKILFLDDIFIGLDTSNRLALLKILLAYKKPIVEEEATEEGIISRLQTLEGVVQRENNVFFSSYQVFITTYDKNWYEIARVHLGSNWYPVEMYVGENTLPVILTDKLDAYSKAKSYFSAFDYNASGNSIRRAVERKIEELVPVAYRLNASDLNDLIERLFTYYADCNCSDLMTEQLKRQLLLFKDIVFNPASHNDIKSPLYKAEIERAINIYEELTHLQLIKRELLVGMRASLIYLNEALHYEATYSLRENLYLIILADGSYRVTDPKHNLITYSRNNIAFCKPDVDEAITQEEIDRAKNLTIKLSDRFTRIKRFLNLPDDISVGNLHMGDGNTVGQLINNLL